MVGNGYCADINGMDNVARMYYVRMSHEEARDICQFDEGCVAYAQALDPYVKERDVENVVLYSTTLCTTDCSITAWKENPDLIKQAGNDLALTKWNTGKCYVKRKYDDFISKCNLNS